MSDTLLNIADKIDPLSCAVYGDLQEAAQSVNTEWFVIGAAARDMVYEAAYNLPVKRATKDIDFAVLVESWQMFDRLAESLVDQHDFARTVIAHRFTYPKLGFWVDVIPFGGLSDGDTTYRWPDDPDKEISTLGFQEGLDTAITCRISEDPVLDVKVVHPAVLVMLKLLNWKERRRDKNTDAQDSAYAMSNYIYLDNEERLHNEPELYDEPFDMDTIGARLLGRDIVSLVAGKPVEALKSLIQSEIDLRTESELLADMMLGKLFAVETHYSQLLSNLSTGLHES